MGEDLSFCIEVLVRIENAIGLDTNGHISIILEAPGRGKISIAHVAKGGVSLSKEGQATASAEENQKTCLGKTVRKWFGKVRAR